MSRWTAYAGSYVATNYLIVGNTQQRELFIGRQYKGRFDYTIISYMRKCVDQYQLINEETFKLRYYHLLSDCLTVLMCATCILEEKWINKVGCSMLSTSLLD
jgi:hypothetical protein